MIVDPRVQKFWDEAEAAKKEVRRLAMDIAGWRIEHAEQGYYYMTAMPGTPRLAVEVCQDVVWAMKNGRLDIAARLIELVDQYNNASASADMMALRVERESHQKTVRAREEGDLPDYLGEEPEAPAVRLSPDEAKALFTPEE
jgi:hypothetical protein